jgi:phosphatidate cytidylyltransferase
MSVQLPAAAPLLGGVLGAGGLGVLLSGRREFLLRWLSFFAATPILLLAAATGRFGAAALAAGVGLVCACEYGRMLRMDVWTHVALIAGVLGAIGFGITHRTVPLVAVLLLTAVVPVLAGRVRDGLREAALTAWGVAWLGGALAMLPKLGSELLPLAVAVSIGDVAAYFGGALANRGAARYPALATRLSPLSPNKTWAGALVGASAALATLAVLGGFSAAAAVGVTAGAVVGDLIESMVKRGSGVKDAGSWLPGFGGLCDRVDSLLGALLVLAVLS